jgi:hypothetical protein
LKFYHAAISPNKRVMQRGKESIFLISNLILEEKWRKLRANIHQSGIDQFNGLAELSKNWLYFAV